MIRAFASFGPLGRALLDEQIEEHPGVDRLRWARDELMRYRGGIQRIEDADDAFLRGRIETALGEAFAATASSR